MNRSPPYLLRTRGPGQCLEATVETFLSPLNFCWPVPAFQERLSEERPR